MIRALRLRVLVARSHSPFVSSSTRIVRGHTDVYQRRHQNTLVNAGMIPQILKHGEGAKHVLIVHGNRKTVDTFTGVGIDLGIGRSFHYNKLSTPHDIRLVELLPGSGTDDLSCNIIHLNLEDPSHNPYLAVSYMWDDGSKQTLANQSNSALRTEEILCQDGTHLKISKNLNNFLRRVRHAELITPLWIDQLSINQDDEAERSHQVSIMQYMYRKAHRVLLWIGEEDENTLEAFNLVKTLINLDPSVLMTAPPIALADPGFAESNGLPRFPSHEWDALGLIFKRKVFQRIWIIQELALARDVEMMCGSHAMSFIDLALASRIIVDRGWFRFFIKEYGEDCRPNFAANHFNRQLLISSGKQQSLLFLLGVTRRFQATHPVDKIYGLLGLSQVKGQQLDATPLTPALIPDYTKSTEEVYRDITFHLMVSENSLDLLSTVEDKSVRKLKQLPSWVPDYSTWQNITILGLNQGIPYIASGNSPVSITRSGRSNETLHTKAIRLDNIGSVSRPWLAEDHYFNIFHDWCEFLNQQLILTNQLNLVKSNRAIARALIGDFAVTSAQYPAPEDEYFKHFLSFLQHHFQMSGPDMNESQFGGDYSIYLESFHHFGFGRRAFISKEGRIGFGHISVQEGDGIYLLSGGRTPFILRPVADGESFEFLGESYLHGVMNGEAVPSDETKWTTIDIV